MEVSCPACGARYTADDEKLRGKTARMRCKACNELWLVTGPNIASMASFRPPAEQASHGDTGRKRAAVVRNGSEREKRDLFATREPDVGSVKQTLLPPRTFHSSGVGARNENSVLFRVDQLASAAQVKQPPPPEPARANNDASIGGSDDDGIIDLNALSSAAPRKLGSPVAPLFFSETPPVSLDVEGSAGRASSSKRAGKLRVVGIVTLGATIALASVFGIALAFKGEEPVAHVAASSASTPSSTAPAEPTPDVPVPPPAVVAAATSDSESSEPEVQEKKPKRGSAKGRKGKGGRTKAAKGPSKAAAPAAKPAKAADPCGCKGDFNCNIACAAKNGR